MLKCGEIVLKGLNRSKFEARLVKQVRGRLKQYGEFTVSITQSVVYVEPVSCDDLEGAFEACRKVFGINTVQRCAMCDKALEAICACAREYLYPIFAGITTFKVEAKRLDKSYPLTSIGLAQEVGGFLHDAYPHLKPKMDHPEATIRVEIRERGAYISGKSYPGAGGMPLGANGRGLLMLSGGIDSPVAGHMLAKRGLELAAIHFFSYPYTSMEARDKVLQLAEDMSHYTGKIPVFIVPFTEIQEAIRTHCYEDLFTIIMRRFMMRIADKLAEQQECGCIITGESLGQVASQTLEAIAVTNAVCQTPVYRPLIGMDKEEIMKIARKIGTYETSILPFEDCCTVFTPRHPVTKPKLAKVLEEEAKLNMDELVERAVAGITYVVKGV